MFQQVRFLILLLLLAATLGVAGCGGGGNSSGMMAPMSQPQMKLSVADAPPADNAAHVVVVFTGVELTRNSGNPVTITFPAPKSIDLITQRGTASAVLCDQPIPPASYGQIRLMVTADGRADNYYIHFADGSRVGPRRPRLPSTAFTLVSEFTAPL